MAERYKPTPAPRANTSNTVTRLLFSQDDTDRQNVRPPVQETNLDDDDASDDHLDLDGPTSFLGDSYDMGQVIIEQPPTSTHKHVARDLDTDERPGGYVAATMTSPLTTGMKAENARDSEDVNFPNRSILENFTLTSLKPATTFHGQSASGFSSDGMNQPSGDHLHNVDSEFRPSSEANSSEVNTDNQDLRLASRLNISVQTGPTQESSGAIYPPGRPPSHLDNMKTNPVMIGSSPRPLNQSTSRNSSDGMHQHSRSRLRNSDSETVNSLSGDSNDLQLASSPHYIRTRAEHTKDIADDDIVSRLSELQTAASDQPSSLESVDLQFKIQDRIRIIEQTIESDGLMEYPQFANLRIRHQTFKTWPSSSSQCPRKLSRAGFFYLGVKDHCRCFYCGNLLRDWKIDDDPETEHELWFPDCPFVLLTKSRKLNGHELFDHQTVDSINTGLTRLSFQGGDHALYPHIDPYICGVCGIREIGATQLYCMHIVCRKCVPVPDEDGKAWCRICGKEVVKTVAYDSSRRSVCQ